VSDITYLATRTGWLYLTVIIDLFSRMVVDWALGSSLDHDMVVIALKRAVRRRRPSKGLVFHSDLGREDILHWIIYVLQSMKNKN
jgi:transposase InsO family protein